MAMGSECELDTRGARARRSAFRCLFVFVCVSLRFVRVCLCFVEIRLHQENVFFYSVG